MAFYEIDGVRPVVDPTSFVHPLASVIGDVVIGPRCYIGPSASLRGDFGRIVLEAGVNIQDCCIVHGYPNTDTVIEEEGHIGHGAVVHCCRIRRNALVGMNATVIDHAEIGESAIVAAMAFVKAGMKVPPRTLAAGVPAKIVRELTAEELAWKIPATREYQELAVRCLESFRECLPLSALEANRPKLKASPVHTLSTTKGQGH